MDLHYLQCWRVALLLLLMPCGYRCMSVHILDEDPVHVIPGTSLVLKAQINHGPLEEISMVTWEREPETGSPPRKVTLARCPGKNIKCADTLPNAHVSAEQQGTTLKLEGYSPADSGVYAITVTDQNGVKTTAQCIVREYEPVHHVSVSVNVSHSTLVCGEAWGTDPQFSWLYERNAISKSVGSVSKDGKTLYLVSSAPICGHFTCMVTNKLGHSVATYTAAPCESEGKGRATTAAVVCLVILVACGAVLAFLLWRRKRRYNNRGERLHEHLDDSI